MATFIHERCDGRLVEYRRHPYAETILHVEGRVLQPDGTPFDDRWFRVGDPEFLNLSRCSDILDRLAEQEPGNYWTEREAKGDVNPRRCIHEVPLNVFCGKCER